MVDEGVAQRVANELPNWRIEGEEIAAVFHYADFASAFAAATRVAFLAERANHHPTLTVGWGRLDVRVTTHSEGRLTDRDVELAVQTTEALGVPSAPSSS